MNPLPFNTNNDHHIPRYYPNLIGPSWVSYPELVSLISQLPQKGIFIEIGTASGVTAAVIAESRPNLIIYCLDTFATIPIDEQPELCAEAVEGRKLHWTTNMLFNSNVQLVEFTLKEFLARSPNLFSYLAETELPVFVFVDGSHKYEDVYEDLTLVGDLPNLNKVFVHDYGDPFWTGVTQAVDTFCHITNRNITNRCNSLVTLERFDINV